MGKVSKVNFINDCRSLAHFLRFGWGPVRYFCTKLTKQWEDQIPHLCDCSCKASARTTWGLIAATPIFPLRKRRRKRKRLVSTSKRSLPSATLSRQGASTQPCTPTTSRPLTKFPFLSSTNCTVSRQMISRFISASYCFLFHPSICLTNIIFGGRCK